MDFTVLWNCDSSLIKTICGKILNGGNWGCPGWVSWAWLAWRRLQRDLFAAFQYFKVAYKQEGEGLFT